MSREKADCARYLSYFCTYFYNQIALNPRIKLFFLPFPEFFFCILSRKHKSLYHFSDTINNFDFMLSFGVNMEYFLPFAHVILTALAVLCMKRKARMGEKTERKELNF